MTEMKSVYCTVRTGSLNKAVCDSSLKVLKKEYEVCGYDLTQNRHKEQTSVSATMGFWYLEKLGNVLFIWAMISL